MPATCFCWPNTLAPSLVLACHALDGLKGAAVLGAGPMLLQRGQVCRDAVALVLCKAVLRVLLVHLHHQAVPRHL
jgi:hypothetical protein